MQFAVEAPGVIRGDGKNQSLRFDPVTLPALIGWVRAMHHGAHYCVPQRQRAQ